MIAILAAACIVAGVTATRAPAQSALEKFNALQSKLDDVQSRESVTTQTISSYSGRIRDLQDQILALQDERDAARARLDEVQAQLDAATAQLADLRSHLDRAVELLGDRLVDIYKAGEPDTLTVILEANGFDELIENGPYLRRINSMDSDVVDRVRSLRDQVQATVDQVTASRDEIAAKKAELDRAAADITSRKSELADARAGQQKSLAGLKDQKKHLEGDLADASKDVAKELGTYATPLPAGAIKPGQAGFIWPVNGSIVSPFGMRWGRMHEGVDIAVPSGTPIRAAKDGTIVIAGEVSGYGNYTCIDHGGGLSTCYAHQSSFAMLKGAQIKQGEILGYAGCTGHCFGPHVHFEVRINGAPVDPLHYL